MHVFNVSFYFNGKTIMCWHERNFCFNLKAFFFPYCNLVIPTLLLFLSDTVHFESVHRRKCKPHVLCMSLCLLSKVCVITVTM